MKLFGALFALMLAVGAVSFWAWRAAPVPAPCQDESVSSSRSPEGRTQADVFHRHCGESVSTHVALRPAAAPAQARGDVFIAAGSVPVEIFWSGERELVVQSSAPRVLVEETSWRNVSVRLRRIR